MEVAHCPHRLAAAAIFASQMALNFRFLRLLPATDAALPFSLAQRARCAAAIAALAAGDILCPRFPGGLPGPRVPGGPVQEFNPGAGAFVNFNPV